MERPGVLDADGKNGKNGMEVDLSQLSAKTRDTVDRILRTDYELKVLHAIRRQVKVAAQNHLHRPAAQDGFGERVFAIDAQIDALWRSFYGCSYTEDKDLMKFLARRNPEITVKSRGTKIQVGYGTCGESRRPVGILTTDGHG